MEFEDVRPYISGLAGGLIATLLGVYWARRAPRTIRGKSREWLADTYRLSIFWANGALMTGILGSLALYVFGLFADNQWEPLGLGFGGGCVGALIALTLVPLLTRGSPRDAFSAYAISQKTPAPILYSILAFGAVLFSLAGWSVLT